MSSANEGAAFETLLAACLAAESDIRLSRCNTNTDDEYVLNALLALQKKKFLTHHKQSKLPRSSRSTRPLSYGRVIRCARRNSANCVKEKQTEFQVSLTALRGSTF